MNLFGYLCIDDSLERYIHVRISFIFTSMLLKVENFQYNLLELSPYPPCNSPEPSS